MSVKLLTIPPFVAEVHTTGEAFDGSVIAQRTNPPFVAEARSGEPTEFSYMCRRLRTCQTPAFPPPDMQDLVGGKEPRFTAMGLNVFYDIALTCDLRPYSRLLEIGCGCGRIARLLAPFLDPQAGAYFGFDVNERMIQWCQEHIAPVFPNTRFDFADVHNSAYNPSGAVMPYEHRFPYQDRQFDIVIMPSVFTHMTRRGVEHYLLEIARVLKPHGRLLLWFFLTSHERIAGKESKESSNLTPYDAVSLIRDVNNPDAFIAYDTDYVMGTLRTVGFTVRAVMTGTWDGCFPTGPLSLQDRILATRSS